MRLAGTPDVLRNRLLIPILALFAMSVPSLTAAAEDVTHPDFLRLYGESHRFANGKPGQDRAPRRIGQRAERRIQVFSWCHSITLWFDNR